jgi:hypothetical protein
VVSCCATYAGYLISSIWSGRAYYRRERGSRVASMGDAMGLRVRVSARFGRVVLGRRRLPAGAVAARMRVLVLGVCCTGLLGVVGVAPAAAATKAKTCQPREGAQGKARFTVWYCEGDKLGRALAPAVAIHLDAVWARETEPEPNGLGPPITPEANGGRISVYVTAPDEAVHLGKCPDFCEPVGAANGFARPVAPFSKNRAGGLTSSGALVINEKKGVTDATVIHEFFHVLEMAHNWPAVGTWLGEATATWAEHKYGAADNSRLTFFKEFQREPTAGLTSRDAYGAYVWLIWLAQRRSDRAVFRLWSALRRARAKFETSPPESLNDVVDQKVFDSVVREYLATHKLSWAQHFKDFAVEDLNSYLSPKVTPHLFGRGPFGDREIGAVLPPELLSPAFIRPPSTLTTGTRRTAVGPKAGLAPLGTQYEHVIAISDQVKAVVITANGMKRWGDLVVLADTGSRWQRRDLQNGSVTFCRRTSGQDVKELYLIADNHDDLKPHSGARYTVTGEPTCS